MSNATELPVAAVMALEQGQMLAAIKIIREQTGLGLKESKEMVEEYIDQHAATLAPHLARRRDSANNAIKVFIVLVVIGWLAFLFIGD
ncbi:MAG: ribosomal protein L7/L12 [Gammaproteobacteria bacterium]